MTVVRWMFFALCVALVPGHAIAQANDPCPRPADGSIVTPPPDLFSQNGVLSVNMNYSTRLDEFGRTLFCFNTPAGMESPTLHVKPGDEIRILLTDLVPAVHNGQSEILTGSSDVCGSTIMSPSTVNMHFHGTNVAPTCHSDEVIRTLVNPGKPFQYVIKIPRDEPPGLYWYHPHVHGIASPAVQGGASGVIEVEGIANIQPAVAGLPERFLVIRDQPLAHPRQGKKLQPFWDLSLNYVPISYPKYQPAIIKMNPGVQEFWRVTNAAANTIMDVKLLYDGKKQPLQIVGLDGVPTGSQDGKRQGTIVTQKEILIPPAGRAEFIVTGPSANVTTAMLITDKIDTGPAGDVDTRRPLAQIVTTNAATGLPRTQERNGPPNIQRFENLADARVTANRKLYFAELPPGPDEQNVSPRKTKPPADLARFRITVEGQQERLFDPNEPPAITTTQGAVEDWIVENRTFELHEFHMHQIHFLVLAVNGVPIPRKKQQFRDTFQVPYWTGSGPYPSIKVRMDFRGAVVGDFVYHCHILDHEDAGMMAKIRVLPKT